MMKIARRRSFKNALIKHGILMLLAIFILGQRQSLSLAQDEKPSAGDKRSQAAKPDKAPSNPADDTPYVIGNTDRLSVTFWQQPDLNREVRVSEDGNISLPVIGEIKAAGMITSELAKKIVQQMSIYNTPISQATVTVLEFNSRSVVVSGQVRLPGTYRYEKMPDVWTAIVDAGGPLTDADLSRVTIVRKVGGKSDLINVNLYKIIKDGDLSKAPPLEAGDLVNVPLSAFGTPLELTSSYVAPTGKNIFYVFGQVNDQGPRNLDAGMDVLDAVAVAGGFTTEADLKNVRVIIKDRQYSSVVKIDLEKYIETGRPARLTLHPEDTIIIPARSEGIFSSALSVLGSIVPILGGVGTLILLAR